MPFGQQPGKGQKRPKPIRYDSRMALNELLAAQSARNRKGKSGSGDQLAAESETITIPTTVSERSSLNPKAPASVPFAMAKANFNSTSGVQDRTSCSYTASREPATPRSNRNRKGYKVPHPITAPLQTNAADETFFFPGRDAFAPPSTAQPNLSACFETLQHTPRTLQNSYGLEKLPQAEYDNRYGDQTGKHRQTSMPGHFQMQHDPHQKRHNDWYHQSIQPHLDVLQNSRRSLVDLFSRNMTRSDECLPGPQADHPHPINYDKSQRSRDNRRVVTNSHHIIDNFQQQDAIGPYATTGVQRQDTSGLHTILNTQHQNANDPHMASKLPRQDTSSSWITADIHEQNINDPYATPTSQCQDSHATTGSQPSSSTSYIRLMTQNLPVAWESLLLTDSSSLRDSQTEPPASLSRYPQPPIGYELDLVRRRVVPTIEEAIIITNYDTSNNTSEPSPNTLRHHTVQAKVNFAEWGQPPEHAIDRSPAGALSIRDPLWGSPPVRVGRDPRYQQVSTHDGRRTYLEDAPGGGRV